MRSGDARAWTTAALFGGLWGAAELSLGVLLSAAHVPLGGMVMAALGVVCLVTARRLHPAVGQSLAMGVVVAFLKVFSMGGMLLGPMVGILVEAEMVEIAFTGAGSSLPAAILGGAGALAWAPSWALLSGALLAGPEAVQAVDRGMRTVAGSFGWRGATSGAIIATLIGAAALLGGLVGAFAWRLAGRVVARVRGAA